VAIPVLERQRVPSPRDLGRLGGGSLTVVGMDEVEIGPRQELLARVAEDLLQGGIDAREVPVEVPLICVEATPPGLTAGTSAAAIPGSRLRSPPRTSRGGEPETSVAGR